MKICTLIAHFYVIGVLDNFLWKALIRFSDHVFVDTTDPFIYFLAGVLFGIPQVLVFKTMNRSIEAIYDEK